jgi:hypothetical protein
MEYPPLVLEVEGLLETGGQFMAQVEISDPGRAKVRNLIYGLGEFGHSDAPVIGFGTATLADLTVGL